MAKRHRIRRARVAVRIGGILAAAMAFVAPGACSATPEAGPTAPVPVQDAHDGRPQFASLPRLPWEGGPAYWAAFPDASDWTEPGFFPIAIWYNGVSDDAEIAWDKAHGINTYSGMWEGTDFALFERNDVYWLGEALNTTFVDGSRNWPGVFLGDEVDGRFEPDVGLAELEAVQDLQATNGRFTYANFTQLVIGGDLALSDQESYVGIPDVVSVDMYWYTIPFCDWTPYRGTMYADPVPQETCRTASSYGRTLDALTIRDSADGELRPRWAVIENLNGLSGHEHVGYIDPDQLQGAAMSAIINEARGILWFNQSFTGPCQSNNVVRTAQVEGASWCGAEQVAAMGAVNNLILGLAPIINTQSLEWDFGSGLDTMLKTDGDHAYIFAMTDGGTGERTLTLPGGVRGATADVIGEGRSVDVRDLALVDDFGNEHDFHIYRIAL